MKGESVFRPQSVERTAELSLGSGVTRLFHKRGKSVEGFRICIFEQFRCRSSGGQGSIGGGF